MINNDTSVVVGEAKEKRKEAEQESMVNTTEEGRIKDANEDDAMAVDKEEDDQDEYDDLMSVEDDEDDDEEDDDLDEALAAAQNMPLRKRKIRGRANGSNRKKKARIAESTEPEITQEERDLRTLYITNVPFEVVESDFDIFKPFGEIHSIRISRTRSTGKLCGIAHVEFCHEESALKAIVKFSDLENKEGELHGRRIHVDRADSKLAKWHLMPSTLANRVGEFIRTPQFRLPKKMAKELVRLFKEKNYEGKNISCLKCAYEKTHLGKKEKLDVSKYGFRKFSAALRTIPQLRLENSKLTIVAYLVEEKKDAEKEDADAEKSTTKNNEPSTTEKNSKHDEEKKKEEKDEDEHPMKTTTEAVSKDTSATTTNTRGHTFDDEEANKKFFLEHEDD